MKKGRALFIVLMLLLVGCQSNTPEPVPTETTTPPTPTAVPPTEEPIVEVVQEVDHCISCHTDKERLIATADPVEEDHESESSGVG